MWKYHILYIIETKLEFQAGDKVKHRVDNVTFSSPDCPLSAAISWWFCSYLITVWQQQAEHQDHLYAPAESRECYFTGDITMQTTPNVEWSLCSSRNINIISVKFDTIPHRSHTLMVSVLTMDLPPSPLPPIYEYLVSIPSLHWQTLILSFRNKVHKVPA